MNVITLTGNATKDVELSYSPQGTAFAKGTIAVQRNFKNQNGEYETDFINFKGIGRLGEVIAEHVKKGDRFGIAGSLQINTFDKEDGTRAYFTEVVVNNFDFPSKKGNNASNNQSNTNTQQKDQKPYTGQNEANEDPFANDGEQIDIKDDDLPF